MSIGNRIKALRNSLKLTQQQFADILDVDQGHIAGIERGSKKPSKPLQKVISLALYVNEIWLKTGEGEMFISPEAAVENIRARFGEQALLVALYHDLKKGDPDRTPVHVDTDNGRAPDSVSEGGALCIPGSCLREALRSRFPELMRDRSGGMVSGFQLVPDQDYLQIAEYLAALWKDGDQRKRDWLVVQFQNAFPDARRISVAQEPEHPELTRMIKYLSAIWDSSDQRLKNWACVQFEGAFPGFQLEVKNATG